MLISCDKDAGVCNQDFFFFVLVSIWTYDDLDSCMHYRENIFVQMVHRWWVKLNSCFSLLGVFFTACFRGITKKIHFIKCLMFFLASVIFGQVHVLLFVILWSLGPAWVSVTYLTWKPCFQRNSFDETKWSHSLRWLCFLCLSSIFSCIILLGVCVWTLFES